MRAVYDCCKFAYDDVNSHFSKENQRTERIKSLKIVVDKLQSWTIETKITEDDWVTIEKTVKMFLRTYCRVHSEDTDSYEFMISVAKSTVQRMYDSFMVGE